MIKAIPTLQPDVIVMDIHMQQYNGIKLTKELLIKYPKVKIMILSGYDYEEYYTAAMDAGARAYITKERSFFELATAIRQTYKGEMLFRKSQIDTNNFERLTPTEKKILTLISKDKSNFDISTELQISKRTVEYHVSAIIRKLGVDSRVGAVVKGIKKGLICDF